MKHIVCIGFLCVLAACGVDGEPVRPQASATVGVSGGDVTVGGAVGLRKGPISVLLGF